MRKCCLCSFPFTQYIVTNKYINNNCVGVCQNKEKTRLVFENDVKMDFE